MIIYEEIPDDAMREHDTYVIAFCPDIDTFFVTNQRAFFGKQNRILKQKRTQLNTLS